jgi:hypothetical protein
MFVLLTTMQCRAALNTSSATSSHWCHLCGGGEFLILYFLSPAFSCSVCISCFCVNRRSKFSQLPLAVSFEECPAYLQVHTQKERHHSLHAAFGGSSSCDAAGTDVGFGKHDPHDCFAGEHVP